MAFLRDAPIHHQTVPPQAGPPVITGARSIPAGRRTSKTRSLPGLLLFDANGHLLSANPTADALLPARHRQPVMQAVRTVLKTQVAKAPWTATVTGAPVGPLHQTVLRSGTRTLGLQTYWLNHQANGQAPLVAVLIERVAPRRAGRAGLGKAQRSYGLSPREMDVVEALRNGMSDKEIASSLGIGFETVRDYLKAIRRKLGVSTRTAIISTILST
jgi:DNA-binding CsgD family transcriptional regulator